MYREEAVCTSFAGNSILIRWFHSFMGAFELTEKTYYLDLPTLVGYLHGKSAILQTTLKLAKNQPPCQGLLFLLHTALSHSYIISQSGELVSEGDEAYRRLSQSKEWLVRIDGEATIGQEWLAWLQERNLTPATPVLPPSAAMLRPKRALDALLLRPFTAQQALFLRTVFALVNGQRTAEQIKERLPQWSSQAIDDALHVLHTLGLIE